MSIHNSIMHFILAVNKKSKLKGKFLSIGRQSVYMNKTDFMKLLKLYNHKYGFEKIKEFSFVNKKDFTRNKQKSLMSDSELMKIFPNLKYETLDKSKYEKAEKVLDLNRADKKFGFKTKYNYIFDGGSLDNVFSPSNAINNLNKMLKKNGTIIHGNVGTISPGAYCSFSCEWFFSYYSINNFKNVQVFLAVPIDYRWPNPTLAIYNFSPYFKRKKNYNPLYFSKFPKYSSPGAAVFCIAQKGENSTYNKIPIQSHYLERGDFDWRKNYKKYHNYNYEIKFFTKKKIKKIIPLNTDHYKYQGIIK